jgi:hypothetical protein
MSSHQRLAEVFRHFGLRVAEGTVASQLDDRLKLGKLAIRKRRQLHEVHLLVGGVCHQPAHLRLVGVDGFACASIGVEVRRIVRDDVATLAGFGVQQRGKHLVECDPCPIGDRDRFVRPVEALNASKSEDDRCGEHEHRSDEGSNHTRGQVLQQQFRCVSVVPHRSDDNASLEVRCAGKSRKSDYRRDHLENERDAAQGIKNNRYRVLMSWESRYCSEKSDPQSSSVVAVFNSNPGGDLDRALMC